MLGYQADPQSYAQGYMPAEMYGNYLAPEDMQAQDMQPVMSGMVAIEAIPQPAQQLAERWPAHKLFQCYESWEQAKWSENQEAFIASRYYHSKQWTEAELRELRKRRQPITTKNRIKRKVDFLVGIEQRLRRDPKAYPRTPGSEQAAYVFTCCLRSIEDETKWQAVASECANDGMIRGIGAVWQGARMVKGRPEIRKSHIPADRFFYDPCSERWDFSDCRFLGEWQWLDIDEAKELLPFAADSIETLATAGNEGSLSILPQEFAKSRNRQEWLDARGRRIKIVSIWYKCRGRWMFDYLVGAISLCPEGYDCLSPYIGEEDDISGDPAQWMRDHPYNPWSPYVDESGDRYGVVRDMIPLQDEINKRTSKMLYMLTVNQTQGEVGAVTDVEKFKTEKARPDGHMEYNKGFAFEVVDQTVQTNGQFELLQEAKAEIENLGPNPGLIGRGVEKQSGRAILAQQNSGMTELSPVFERMKQWKLRVYHKDARLAKQFWKGERFIRVTEDPRAVEHLQINRVIEDPMTGQITMQNAIAEMDVDVILDEGPDTITMREEIIEAIGDRPDVPLDLIIELSSLPDKEYLIKRIKESQAPPPELIAMQERMSALEELLKAAQADKAVADADAQRASTLKTLSEIMAPKPVPSHGGPAGAKPGSAKPGAAKAPAPAPAPPKDPNAILNELMMATELLSQAFPVYYREPTNVDMIKMAGPPGQQMGGVPENAMMGGQQAGPEGMPLEQGAPNYPNPMMNSEPQVGQSGGLPLGLGVGA